MTGWGRWAPCRITQKEEEDGVVKTAVRPYLMDLGSVNGTFLNGDRLEAQRYYELIAEVSHVLYCMPPLCNFQRASKYFGACGAQ